MKKMVLMVSIVLTLCVLGGETGNILGVYRASDGTYTVQCQDANGSTRIIAGRQGLLDGITDPCVALSITQVEVDTTGHTQRVVTYFTPRLDAVATGNSEYLLWIGQRKNLMMFQEWGKNDESIGWYALGFLVFLLILGGLKRIRFCNKCGKMMTRVQMYWTDGLSCSIPNGHYYNCDHCNPPRE